MGVGGVGRIEACEALLLKGARWASSPGLTKNVDPSLVYGDAQGASPMLHGGYERPRLCLHIVALYAVELVLTIVAPRSIDTVVQDADS